MATVAASPPFGTVSQVDAGVLNVGYVDAGPQDGPAVVLMHGWPERRLSEAPAITVPAITLEGDANGAPHPEPAAYAAKFAGAYTHRTIAGGVGHNLPQEAPHAFAEAILEVGT